MVLFGYGASRHAIEKNVVHHPCEQRRCEKKAREARRGEQAYARARHSVHKLLVGKCSGSHVESEVCAVGQFEEYGVGGKPRGLHLGFEALL